MNPITFPGLGITLNLDRVAVSLGGKPIYWYGVIIAVGFILAAYYATRICRSYGITEDNVLDMLIFALPIGIIGARLYYVIFYFSLYQNADGSVNWGEVIAIWDGGLAIYGGIIAAAITVVIYSRVKKLSVGAFLDVGAFGLLIGQAIGRWGNFVNQEAFGGETTLPWRMGLTVGDTYMEVHPTFLYECLWNVAGFFLLRWLMKRFRRFDGQAFITYVGWYGLGRMWIEGLRTDSLYFFDLTLMGMPIRTSQMLATLSLLAALGLLIWQLKFRKHTPEQLYVNQVTLPEKPNKRSKTKQADAQPSKAEEPQNEEEL